MTRNEIDAVIIPSTDPHQSEYPPEHHRVRSWITGFDGSAGTAVITAADAGLWTDSRYFLEAEKAIDGTGFRLFRLHTSGTPNYPEWLGREVRENGRVAVDMRTVTVNAVRELERRFRKKSIQLTDLGNGITEMWTSRPAVPASLLYRVPDEISGGSTAEKIGRIRSTMATEGARSHVVGTLDDIAWILNLRGADVPYNPVFLAYLIIDDTRTTLYTDTGRVSGEVKSYLDENGITLAEYDSFYTDISDMNGPVMIDPDRLSYAVATTWNAAARVETIQPSTVMKARKNTVELGHIRNVMRRDGAAMVRFLRQFDDRVRSGETFTEIEAAEMLRRQRRDTDNYVGDSFNYISGFNGNGAIVHYAAEPRSTATITSPGVYLIDSGGQYRDGTTDITRTVAVGAVDPGAQRDFTLVLKGHIALATLVFPAGTSGRDIDAIARMPLWSEHCNYGHGTGHGVGFFLNVHEGPQRIAPSSSDWPLEGGMVVSNEPGLYRPGKWGIRIENLLAVSIPADTTETEFGAFLTFETLTLCPIDRRMIDLDMLTPSERSWVDSYHRTVRLQIEPLLNDADDRRWLEEATAPL